MPQKMVEAKTIEVYKLEANQQIRRLRAMGIRHRGELGRPVITIVGWQGSFRSKVATSVAIYLCSW